ncbi:hypothetical protein [Candidatus Pelagibacter communis]|uniref:hypothetical protein n=1 Tax=Candidatus Pelagibacter TaxID=198251 RepID=UPI003EE13D72
MSKDLDNKYFIILNSNEIIFSCLNNENKISFTKKHILKNGLNNQFIELENFFIENLIEIEKSLKDFIKNIYLIFDTGNSLSVDLSTKSNFESKPINKKKINDILNSLKNEFSKYTNEQKIIHMAISKSLVDGKEKDLSLIDDDFKNLILELKFECLKNQTVHIVKKIFSNYQILVERILIADYLRQNINYKKDKDDIVYLANKFLSSRNNEEIFFTQKRLVKQGFFERFLNFFC